jgi:hypothetical protein
MGLSTHLFRQQLQLPCAPRRRHRRRLLTRHSTPTAAAAATTAGSSTRTTEVLVPEARGRHVLRQGGTVGARVLHRRRLQPRHRRVVLAHLFSVKGRILKWVPVGFERVSVG